MVILLPSQGTYSVVGVQALIRDGYRCMVTRSYDYIHAPDDDSPITTTQCCHIISPALTGDIVGGDDLTVKTTHSIAVSSNL
jgi:hypothetical protein